MRTAKAFAAVFHREIVERRLLLLAGAVVGLTPLLMTWIPYFGAGGAAKTTALRGVTALFLSMALTAVAALLLGGSILARDLAERRISFYFSRPIPGWVIWAGKLLAALALTLAAGSLALLPALLHGDVEPSTWQALLSVEVLDNGQGLLVLGYLALLLLLVGHTVGVVLRARSGWLILDLAALLVSAFLIFNAVLLLRPAPELRRGALDLLLVALPLGALVASAVQVVRGRTDLRRSHRLLTVTLSSVLLTLALGLTVLTRWVFAATPRDLDSFSFIRPAPAGSWVWLSGRAAHRGGYQPRFLLDTASGRYIPAAVAGDRDFFLSFSGDGRRAAVLGWTSDPAWTLMSADLTRPEAGLVATPIAFSMFPESIALSRDGSRLASIVDGRLRIDELSTGRMLASVPLPAGVQVWRLTYGERSVTFADERLMPDFEGRSLDFLALDLASLRLERVGRIQFHGAIWRLSDDGRRVFLHDQPGQAIRVHDVRTGALLATLPVGKVTYLGIIPLASGRFAVRLPRPGSFELRVYAADGTLLRRLWVAGPLRVGAQPTADTLVVAHHGTAWRLDLNDPGPGGIHRIGRGLEPLNAPYLPPGSPASRLFTTKNSGLVQVDPATGKEERVILPGR